MSSIIIKNEYEINKIRKACILASENLKMIQKYLKPGIDTNKINNICHKYITHKQKAIPACLGYKGFPKSICTSINDTICHGIPNKLEVLNEGDIINIDIAVIKDGFYGDVSKMFFIGKVNKIAKNLCFSTRKSLYKSLKIIKPGAYFSEIGKVIQKYIKKKNFSIVKEYCGHGVGKKFHEEPYILHYDSQYNKNIQMKEGMIFTIEPMINIGKPFIKILNDGWTVKTIDHSLSAQYEHTVLVTKNGCEILTIQEDEKINPIIKNI
ncbi:type I methionyl aminopeptidase [Buchnera aphidicola (Kurisakia onigurumii)]|uniref:type I methionyl aminopeptidase n=1 Tax=Buchnera aphidicola TaxID=9 RepID=UPI0031B6CC32